MDKSRTCQSCEVRIGHSLSEVERQHLARRTETVLQCLKQHGITCSEDDMPNIAVLGSGGGLRAMVGLLGSLSQLKEERLLDCIMYLCGVSGSTWCMASLYNEPNWSTKLETVKDSTVQRLAEGSVSWWKMGKKLANYYSNNDNFSLTDVWAALIVSNMVKEIDEHRLSEQRGNYTSDPYPIYTVIDKQCKYDRLNADVWFEITPDESGYSLSGAFVDSSCLGSQFENGKKIKDQPEIDMLYLQEMGQTSSSQSVCGSDVRIGHSLSEAERQHLARRRETVLQCLKQHGITCTEDEMPNIAVLGSGGGLRAMVGLLGSLCQLKEEGLLDCIMYLSGVSGSTWCMASLYKEPNWSTKLDTVKNNIVQRLADGSVSLKEMGEKLAKYYSEKDNFSLTDVWSVLIVSNMVNEIDEHKLTEQRGKYTKDPYPVYTVIDKQSKYDRLNADPWFEITPDESGYSLSGVFVDSSCLGSQFENGNKIKKQPEIDMLYLQGLCGSVLADMEQILQKLQELISPTTGSVKQRKASQTPDVPKAPEALLTLVELNLRALKKKDLTNHLKAMDEHLKEYKETETMTLRQEGGEKSAKTISKMELKDYTLRACSSITDMYKEQGSKDESWIAILRSMEKLVHWTWGTNHNYLYRMKVESINPSVLKSKTRHYEDAGLLLNSPYFAMLRKERDIDLIISLDYSEGDPFETVVQTAEKCKDLQIPFPEVVLPAENTEPQDFYVFKGSSDAPTVIHIPLFNAVNCKGEIKKWEKRYSTFQMNYSREMITDLLEKAGLNIKNNKEKLLKEIENVIGQKKTSKLGKV
ncbi:cytosolic phospholipase A2 gamma-like [Colossoma macropomum]|uniref:cytosolic phospholipase A2 gamma-like n=1 Tax=Colossoma macropomum TaxID=42526 RepID=UPI00186537A4|nr:cytosolic phospholipase A2 gamma-like [Colossoma macropomum]XP_036423188.1 cytosolic phospholipase A2 gamma-like [Colossoma macropomum]